MFFQFCCSSVILINTLCDHVKLFSTDRPSDADAVSNVETLFRDIEQSREQSCRPIRTHECIIRDVLCIIRPDSLGLTGYVKNI